MVFKYFVNECQAGAVWWCTEGSTFKQPHIYLATWWWCSAAKSWSCSLKDSLFPNRVFSMSYLNLPLASWIGSKWAYKDKLKWQQLFYDLFLGFLKYHFHHILLVMVTSKAYHFEGEGTFITHWWVNLRFYKIIWNGRDCLKNTFSIYFKQFNQPFWIIVAKTFEFEVWKVDIFSLSSISKGNHMLFTLKFDIFFLWEYLLLFISRLRNFLVNFFIKFLITEKFVLLKCCVHFTCILFIISDYISVTKIIISLSCNVLFILWYWAYYDSHVK